MADRERRYVFSSTHDSLLAAQVVETRAMAKRSYFLSFDKLQGELHYQRAQPEQLRLTVAIDATTVACRTGALRAGQRQHRADCARDQVLQAVLHPTIHFASSRTTPKALRGLVVEGTLQVRGTTCAHKLNVVITPSGGEGFEIEGDSLLQLSDFGIVIPSRWGWVRTSEAVLLHWRLYAVPVWQERA